MTTGCLNVTEYFYFANKLQFEKVTCKLNLSYFISAKIRNGQKDGLAATIHMIAIFSIGIGLAATIVSFLIMKGFQETVKNKIYGFSGHLLITKFSMNNSPEEQPMDYNLEIYKDRSQFPFVKHVQEFAHKAGLIKTENDVVGIVVKGIGKTFDVSGFQENITDGRFLNFPDSGYANEIMLSKTIANIIEKQVGDDVIVHFFQNPPRFRKLKVVGIYETNLSEYFDSKIIIGDIRLIQRLNDWADSVGGGLEIFIDPTQFDQSSLIREQVEFEFQDEGWEHPNFLQKAIKSFSVWLTFDEETAALEKARAEIGELNDYDQNIELIKDRYEQVFEWLHLVSRQVNILLAIILVVVCFNMISIILILVMERTQMIGMLKALGAPDGLIRSIFIHNGLNLILKGLVLGNILGLGLCFLQYQFKFITLNPRDYYMSYVPISWHWDIVLWLNILTLLVVSIILLLPTMAISRIRPIRAIRFD
jgi:lipoprotein-releasing system permease protein